MTVESTVKKHPAQGLTCPVAYFGNYADETIEGIRYVVATERHPDKETFTFEKYECTDLLLSMLKLYESLTPNIYGRPEAIDQRLTDQDMQKIIEWCRVNGLPFEETGGASVFHENSVWRKQRKVGFQVAKFYARLHHLYQCYELWRALYLTDISPDNYYVKHGTSRSECLLILQGHMSTLDLRYVPDFDVPADEHPVFKLMCPDLLEVAKAHLYFEITLDEYNLSIGICEVCGNTYTKSRRNNTLCSACQATKYKRSREKKRKIEKGDQQNGINS